MGEGLIFLNRMSESIPERGVRAMKSEHGFTLNEILTTMAILAVMITISIPYMTEFLSNQELSGEARNIQSALNQGRMRAIKENEIVVMFFDGKNDSYKGFVDDGAGVDANRANGVLDTDETVFVNSGIPDEMTFSDVDFSGSSFIRFNGNGVASSTGNVTIKNDKNRYRRIRVTSVAGTTVIELSEDGNNWS